MDTYSYNTSTNSTSSSSSSYNSSNSPKNGKHSPAFRSSLRSVRKNVITKKPIAPLPPTRPKIYKVDPIDFMDVVQKLTAGAPEFIPTRLQEVAPPPLSLSPPHHRFPIIAKTAQVQEKQDQKSFESMFGALSPLGFSLSPSSLAWFSSNLLSPGTHSSLEPSAVL